LSKRFEESFLDPFDWLESEKANSHISHTRDTMPPRVNTAQRRLLKEYQQLTKDSPEGIVAGPVSEE